MSISGIYKLTFPGGSTYIGKSVDIERRWREHAESMRKGTAAKKMQNAYILEGFPDSEVLLECHPDHIDLMESVFIIAQNPSLNTGIPIKLQQSEIDILCADSHALEYSTATHMLSMRNLTNDKIALENTINDLEEIIDELDTTRTEEELKTELGRRLAEMKVNHIALTNNYESVLEINANLNKELAKPWWKRIFA